MKVGSDPNQTIAKAAFEAKLGRKIDSVLVFGDTTNLGVGFAINETPDVRCVVSQCMMPPGTNMASAAGGSIDSLINSAVADYVANSQKVIGIRIGWEFNITGQYPWCAGGNGSNQTASNYIALFQRWVNFLRLKVPHIPIIWNPNFDSDGSDHYPGDQYVDCVAIDCYDNSSFYADNFDFAVSAVNGLRWMEGFAATHGKMIGVGEWATNYNSGNYITPMGLWLKRPRNNRVLFHSYWNSDASFPGDLANYPIASAAFCAAFGDPGNIYYPSTP
jgi:hypothetical protein